MALLHQYIIFLTVILYSKEVFCFCERFHIVICDDLNDIRSKENDTTTWKYVQIGSIEYRNEQPNEVFDSTIILKLGRTKFLTIINRLNFIKIPFIITSISVLEYLNLYANNIIEIEDYSFGNSKTVKEVYLENNNIQHLGRAVFINATLDIVNLSRNRISSITTGFYYSNIKWILLNHNKISFIKSEAFPYSLEQLELNHNLLQSLENKTFANLWKLKELYLEHNRFTTVPDISDLKSIHYLHFGHNKIEEVHYRFNKHKQLEFVDFSFNSIRNITVDIFSGSSPPLVLLAMNRMTNMVFKHPENKTDLYIYGNPWNCDCLFHIERTILTYHHLRSCDIKTFDKGQVPLCIENGRCGSPGTIGKAEIDNFLAVVYGYERDVKTCVFRL